MNTHLANLEEIIQVSETLGMLVERFKYTDPSCHQAINLEMVKLIKERQRLINLVKAEIELKDFQDTKTK